MLAKYAMREAQQPRLFKFTYHKNGFYRTLQRQVREKMKSIDESPKMYSKVKGFSYFQGKVGLLEKLLFKLETHF
jgi:hypothetical protein